MKYGINILYGILAIGILFSIFHAINDQGGSALGNIIDTLTITSIILFLSTIVFTLLSFKNNIKKMSVWFLLILSCPLAVMSMTHMTKELSLKMTETTTSEEYVYDVKVDAEKYERDKIRLQKLIDSLIEVKTIEKRSTFALRYFNGKTYTDSLERDWAINLPTTVDYNDIIIDTLFYSESGNEVVAGLLICKVYSELVDYPNGGTEYFGKGFVFDKNNIKPVKMLSYSVTGHTNYKSTSERLRYFYFKKIGTYENELNMNDVRFLNSK